MNLHLIPAGKNIPEDIYVIIEISGHFNQIKYEINKETGMLFVDRFIPTSMFYPCNYGYINHTLSLDNDPIDALVITTFCLQPSSVIRCRPIGVLRMTDESGDDSKIVTVPHNKISTEYDHIKNIQDLSKMEKKRIIHFFKHYKDLEKNKWVEVHGWSDVDEAKIEIISSFKRNQHKLENLK